MTELSTQLAEPEAFDTSTQLDEGRGTTEGQPSKEPEAKESRLDAIKRAADDVAPKEEVKPDEPTKSPDKVEAEPAKEKEKSEGDETPAKVKAEEDPKQDDWSEQRKAEFQKNKIPPDRLLPRAKEMWNSTPQIVRADTHRILREADERVSAAEQSVKEFEAVRPFAEMAKQSGTTIDQALTRFVNMEQSLRSNPTAGFRDLMTNMQMNPVQAIGHILAAYNVQPEQLARHIADNPSEYTPLARPQQQAQPQADTRVQTLEQQLAALQQSLAHRDVEDKIIGPFARENPRYHELETTIAAFLNSDIVPKSLSPYERLSAAYDMADRISPAMKSTAAPDEEEGQTDRVGKDFGGDKSVRGAPSSGVDTTNKRRGKMSRGDALSAAMSELGIAH